MLKTTNDRILVNAWGLGSLFVAFGSMTVRYLINWAGYLTLAAVCIFIGVYLFAKHRPAQAKITRLSKPLLLFLVLCFVSTFWSAYPFETILGSIAQLATTTLAFCLATLLTWEEILRHLATVFRWIISTSLIFELWVAFIIKEPILQPYIPIPDSAHHSLLQEWSRNLLLKGGPIQGVLGSSAILGMYALMAIILFGIQLAAKQIRPITGWLWIVLATVTLVLAKVATMAIAVLAVLVALGLALWGRRVGHKRRWVYITGFSAIGVATWVGYAMPPAVFEALGRDSSLTNRETIWAGVTAIASQHPWFGIGWISYWAPWVEPLRSIATVLDIPVPHAHNAWLDVWLQLGFVGVAIFAVLIYITAQRTWCRAIDQPRRGAGAPLPYAVGSIAPWLIMVALIVQTLSESRILIENGWLLLVIFAVKTKTDYDLPSRDDEHRFRHWRDVPIIQSSQK